MMANKTVSSMMQAQLHDLPKNTSFALEELYFLPIDWLATTLYVYQADRLCRSAKTIKDYKYFSST